MEYSLKMYMAVRQSMKTGDCILWKSRSMIGWLIRKFSRANVNHASLVIKLEQYEGLSDRRFLLEALGSGIVLKFLSRRLTNFKGQVWWLPLRDIYNENRDAIGEWALKQVGVKYDYHSVFKNIVGRVSAEGSKYFCSEFCFMGWITGKIRLKGKAPRPGDISKLHIFKKAIRIL